MKLNELYQNYILDKTSKEANKDFKRFTNAVYTEIDKERDINRKKIRQATKKNKLVYGGYMKMLDTAMLVAPIVNYISQSPQVRKSKDLEHMRKQIQVLFKGVDLKKPKAVVDTAYAIVDNASKGVKSGLYPNFIAFMNDIEPQREKIINGAIKRLTKNTKRFKQTLTEGIYLGYQNYINEGYSKPDAITRTINDNKVNSTTQIKRYLETEMHEDFERAKIENAVANGFKYKYWRTQQDGRVRGTHARMQGKIVKHNEHFIVNGHKALWPGDSSLPIGERINCRCFTEFQFVPRGTRQGYNVPTPKKHTPPPLPLLNDEFDDLLADTFVGETLPEEQTQVKRIKNEEFTDFEHDDVNVYDKNDKVVAKRLELNLYNLRFERTDYLGDVEVGYWEYQYEDGEYVDVPEEWVQEQYDLIANQNVWKRSYNGNENVLLDVYEKYNNEIDKQFMPNFRTYSNAEFPAIVHKQNFDKPPKIVTIEELQAEPNKGWIVVRGYADKSRVNTVKYRKDFEAGDFFISNKGGAMFGRGMYSAIYRREDGTKTNINEPLGVVRDYSIGEGNVDIMHLPPDFNYIDNQEIWDLKEQYAKKMYPNYDELKLTKTQANKELKATQIKYSNLNESLKPKNVPFGEVPPPVQLTPEQKQELDELSDKISEARHKVDRVENDLSDIQANVFSIDDGIFATMAGYDGIYVPDEDYMVILNRSKVQLVEYDEKLSLESNENINKLKPVLEEVSD